MPPPAIEGCILDFRSRFHNSRAYDDLSGSQPFTLPRFLHPFLAGWLAGCNSPDRPTCLPFSPPRSPSFFLPSVQLFRRLTKVALNERSLPRRMILQCAHSLPTPSSYGFNHYHITVSLSMKLSAATLLPSSQNRQHRLKVGIAS